MATTDTVVSPLKQNGCTASLSVFDRTHRDLPLHLCYAPVTAPSFFFLGYRFLPFSPPLLIFTPSLLPLPPVRSPTMAQYSIQYPQVRTSRVADDFSTTLLIRANHQLIHPQQDYYAQDQLSSHSSLMAYSRFSRPLASAPRHAPHYSPYPEMDPYKNKEPPVPVPNLIKKSRGRRVPTEAEAEELGGGPSSKTRMFRCDVLGCGKCFLRGEHLKRHIRSIHTHEKRLSGSFS